MRAMNRIVCKLAVSTWAALAFAGMAIAAGGGSMSGGGTDLPEQRMTPEDRARESYNSGVRRLKDAIEYEEDAAKATEPKKIAKANDKARKAYERAAKEFTRATKDLPTMHEAWNYLGYANRHLGDYDASLAAYAKALALRPNYPEAIEYRGEAFLGLNAIEDAKQAYLSLARSSPALAKELMNAMDKWLAQKRENPSGVEQSTVQNFEAWVKEQRSMAGKSASNEAAPAARW